MTKAELINKVEKENLCLPLNIKINEFQTVPDEDRYGILIKDVGGHYFFLSNCSRFDGNKSSYPDNFPSRYGYKYSYRNFGNVEIANPTSNFKTTGHFESDNQIISKTKTIIIEFDTFVSVNQNF